MQTGKPAAGDFHSYFDHVMTYNLSSIRSQTHKKLTSICYVYHNNDEDGDDN